MSLLKINENLAISESGFLFMANTGESFTVNEIGREIIELLKEEKREDEIIKYLTEVYDVDNETVERDFADFIGMLKNLNLLVEL